MKHNTTKPKTSYTIKQDGAAFKVYDKDSKYRRSLPTRTEAEAFAASLSARRAPERVDAGAGSGWGMAEHSEPVRVQVLQPALFGAEAI